MFAGEHTRRSTGGRVMNDQLSLGIDPVRPPTVIAGATIPQLPALSIRQPWAWLILNRGKDVENRTWPTKFRGRFLIHAAKGCTREEYDCAESFAWCNDVEIPPLKTLPRGGIVGLATLTDCVAASASDWFVGDWGFVLADVQPLPFVPCKGALGFFTPSFP